MVRISVAYPLTTFIFSLLRLGLKHKKIRHGQTDPILFYLRMADIVNWNLNTLQFWSSIVRDGRTIFVVSYFYSFFENGMKLSISFLWILQSPSNYCTSERRCGIYCLAASFAVGRRKLMILITYLLCVKDMQKSYLGSITISFKVTPHSALKATGCFDGWILSWNEHYYRWTTLTRTPKYWKGIFRRK